VKGDEVKPANGSFLEMNSGVIIPPGENSVLDPVTNTFIPGPETGRVGSDGNYIPPKNVQITPEGKILIEVRDPGGKVVVVEKGPTPPVKGGMDFSPPVAAVVTPPAVGARPPRQISGGVQDVNQAVQQFNNGPKNRAIIINSRP
jgi:hypothetical protein